MESTSHFLARQRVRMTRYFRLGIDAQRYADQLERQRIPYTVSKTKTGFKVAAV